MTLWISLVLLYIYADIFSFYRSGYISKVIYGQMGPLTVNQSTLLFSSLLMLIPVLMIILSITMNIRRVYVLNCVIGTVYLIVNISNLIGETWLYYLVYGIIEILITLLIMRTAFREFKARPD
ncbi:DUF6326 family protein [Enterococcus sp. AZ007]|uniref:DUF6326 family protein n=1 Tax=Enterococcus sp. AZ007 TaxID=2774839 RepID=UPI003F68F9EE